MTESKVCNSCNIRKPLTFFSSHSATPDRLRHSCKKCDEERNARQHARDRIYNQWSGLRPAPYVLERDDILPSAPKSDVTYTNARLIPQQVVLPLMYVFGQIEEMRK